jgi:hypothetical protein
MAPTPAELLETYLQDHRAGAETGGDLAHRVAEENAGTPYEPFLVRLAQEIEQDTGILEDVMGRFGVRKPAFKMAGAKVTERLGHLKPNEQLAGYSPLSRVLELEGLRAGVQAKLGLWDSLAQIAPSDDRLDEAEMAGCAARAEAQLQELREHHGRAAREAFAKA